ncbi:hypothetical protein FGO68_gene13844 [Halteria grandinella]|uniref:Uncharacterized protein n=1 Tax=Halteria grandinella TaxID=5974 RepID=A0A8J8T1N5_HALGN|nr:hypothetical protein FGO68_gene13844 [Halteria grandinella]
MVIQSIIVILIDFYAISENRLLLIDQATREPFLMHRNYQFSINENLSSPPNGSELRDATQSNEALHNLRNSLVSVQGSVTSSQNRVEQRDATQVYGGHLNVRNSLVSIHRSETSPSSSEIELRDQIRAPHALLRPMNQLEEGAFGEGAFGGHPNSSFQYQKPQSVSYYVLILFRSLMVGKWEVWQ